MQKSEEYTVLPPVEVSITWQRRQYEPVKLSVAQSILLPPHKELNPDVYARAIRDMANFLYRELNDIMAQWQEAEDEARSRS